MLNTKALEHAVVLIREMAMTTASINRRHSFSPDNHELLGNEADVLRYASDILDNLIKEQLTREQNHETQCQ